MKPSTVFAITLVGALALLEGCAVGPNYKRPAASMPPQFRGVSEQDPSSLGDRKWVEIFQDPVLQRLVQEALSNNRDLKIAAQRVLAGQGQLESTRSSLFPQIGVSAGAGQQRREGSSTLR